MKEKETPALGLAKFATTKRRSALSIAVPAGIAVAAVLAALASLLRSDYPLWWQTFLSFFISTTPVGVAIAWIFVVDLGTIPGRVANPEQTVEFAWANAAAADSFYALLAGLGLVTAGFAVLGNTTVSSILCWVLIGMGCLYAIFYARAKLAK